VNLTIANNFGGILAHILIDLIELANDFLKTISNFGYNELLLKFYTYNIYSYYGCYEKLIPKIESFIHKDIKCSKTISNSRGVEKSREIRVFL
jgi:hypothetical protein